MIIKKLEDLTTEEYTEIFNMLKENKDGASTFLADFINIHGTMALVELIKSLMNESFDDGYNEAY
jgi:hypothetical protein